VKFGRESFRPKWWMRRESQHENDVEEALEEPANQPDLEPVRDQPWVPRSALADRVRRSPRE